ncbi:MAG TPA: prolyl oligopeptidase family serine peptidase [Puia sp.]|uniref:carboxylesterase family protein n=1 Tax=Puia sp. TaxID=2045100 RepID=UPI002CC2E82C|nr:prolyl oligopeptidase family serine peptidase [Puia sp.]HVU96285.1 prolyl oligopeptidase family serine peptidase [Puia sp.]
MITRFASVYCVLIILSTGCSNALKDTGHYVVRDTLPHDSALAIRRRILQVDNGFFEPHSYGGSFTLPYRLLSPAAFAPERRYPLVLVLHSSGTPIGTDNTSQLGVLAKYWAQPSIRKRFPAFVVAPQFPRRSSNYAADSNRKVLVSQPDPCLDDALELVDSLIKALPVDPRRVYVVGFSMGGSGVINSLDRRPDLFAAGIALSGIPDFSRLEALSRIPIWLVHGNGDRENPMATDSLLYHELSAMGGRIKFWEIAGMDHMIDPGLLTGDAMPVWLFRHRREGTK